MPSFFVGKIKSFGQIGRNDDRQPVLIVQHQIQKFGKHLLWLALLQNQQAVFVCPGRVARHFCPLEGLWLVG
jgi:hypothetical protein